MVTFVCEVYEDKQEGHTESRDYRMETNKNKVVGLTQRKDVKPETDNLETGLNCRKPL